MKNRYEKRRILKELLGEKTHCGIQYTGWPCGTCFYAMDFRGNITSDHFHELWQATLLLRGDYRNGEFVFQDDITLNNNIEELIRRLKG